MNLQNVACLFRKDAQSSIVVGGDMASTDKAVAKKVEERNRTVTATAKTVTETRAESAAARSKQVRNVTHHLSPNYCLSFYRGGKQSNIRGPERFKITPRRRNTILLHSSQ